MQFDVGHLEIKDVIVRALAEDIGSGDITSALTVPEHTAAHGQFIAKQDLVVAGMEMLPVIFAERGEVQLELLHRSGAQIPRDTLLAKVRGPARLLLECERVSLNFLQRLSGIATLAARYAQAVAGTKTRVLDTRKTTPGLRRLEKMASAAGGAVNHRMGLFDGVLIKNNHIAAAGGVRQALANAREFDGPVEIEVRTLTELDDALAGGARHLLLDNLTPAEAEDWVRYIDGRATVELSGGITLDNIGAYAAAGADYISCGAITHSAQAVDISFSLHLE